MITEIGIVAGEIWHFLEKQENATLDQLIKGIGKPKDAILMSLGWLAREGHVIVKSEGSNYEVRLTASPQSPSPPST